MAATANNPRPSLYGMYAMQKMGADPTQSQMSQVNSTMTSALADIAELARTKIAGGALKDIAGLNDAPDPMQHVSSMVGVAKDLAAIDESRQRSLREEADRERETRRALEEQVHARAAQGEGQLVQMMSVMLQMNQQAEERRRQDDLRWQERLERQEQMHREEMRRLEEKLEGNNSKQPTKVEDYLIGRALDQLESPPQDPLAVIDRSLQIAQRFSPPSGSGNDNLEVAKLQFTLADKQHEREIEHRRWEAEQRLEEERRRGERQERMLQMFAPFANAFGGRGQPAAQQATGTGAAPTTPVAGAKYRYKCKECGDQMLHDTPGLIGKCNNCGGEVTQVGG